MLIQDKNHIRHQESFHFATNVYKNHGELEPVLTWCRVNCVDEWRWQLCETSSKHRPGLYCFFFDSQLDFVAFMLKWG